MADQSSRILEVEPTREMRTSDPYPWVTITEDGSEFRTHTAHADGYDSEGNYWNGWVYAPRSAEELAEHE